MSSGLVRYQNAGHLHFLTFSCFRHRPILGSPEARDRFLQLLEETRLNYAFNLFGYVVMLDHVHLLVNEPDTKPLATAIQVVKQRFSRTCPETEVWERRYYDFNVRSEDKRLEKLRYIHRNPVTRGLVAEPGQWSWSSFHAYAHHEPGPVQVTRP